MRKLRLSAIKISREITMHYERQKRMLLIFQILLILAALLLAIVGRVDAQGTTEETFSFQTVDVIAVKSDSITNKTVLFLPDADHNLWCGNEGCTKANTVRAENIYNMHFMEGLQYQMPPTQIREKDRYVTFGYLYKDAVENYDAVYVELAIYTIPGNDKEIMGVWSFYVVVGKNKVQLLETYVLHSVDDFNAILSGNYQKIEEELY